MEKIVLCVIDVLKSKTTIKKSKSVKIYLLINGFNKAIMYEIIYVF